MQSLGELALIGLWALWVGRSFLNFNPEIWPLGREFGVQIYGFHFWDLLVRCGTCSLWNGMLNGGSPFLADPFTGALHPISAVAGSLAGAVNGAKLTVLASMWMAGIGQWWMGKAIGLGRWSRLWAALAAVSGGHLVGRMELGAVNLVLSTAATSLALAGALDLAINRSRKAALRLAVLLALSIVAGVGYLQVALLFWAPWIALIALDRKEGQGAPWREFVLAGGLAVLMAGVFLMPFAHVWPSLAKFTDLLFETSQPFEYIPLNLVIHDWDYYLAGGLGSTPFPYLHTLFIGWPAVVLAGIGLVRGRREDRRLLASLTLGAITMFWLASGIPFRWVVGVLPAVAGIRHVALMASLAVPAVLALAGYGVDRLLELVWSFPDAGLYKRRVGSPRSFRPAYLLAIPLAAALIAADELDQHFLATYSNRGAYQAISVLRTADLQWVAVPGGEHFWVEAALDDGLKLTDAVTPFWWGDREPPRPLLEATRDDRPAELLPVDHLDDVPVYRYPENIYAYVEAASGTVPCSAQGLGGDLTVRCESDGGKLVVRENAWDGWSATVNGEPTELSESRWLTMTVPPGTALIRLKYFPADAILGVLLSLTGVIATLLLWRRERHRARRDAIHQEAPSSQSPPPISDQHGIQEALGVTAGRPMTESSPPSPPTSLSRTQLPLLVLGAVTVFAGQLLLQTYPRSPAYAWAIPTLGGLMLIVLALIDSVFARIPAAFRPRLARFRNRLDPATSRLPLFLAALVASATAGLIAGDTVILRLPALALGLWLAAIVLLLFAASAIGRPTGSLPRWEFIGLALLVAAGAAARLILLDKIPWLLAGDEASVGITARELLDGVWTNPFRVAWFSFPSLFFVLPAASIGVFGQTIEALRLPAAIAGAMTVAALFIYARSAFGRLLAFLSAGYLAFFHFHIHFSRIALNNIWDGLILALFAYLLWRAWSEERSALFAWAGIVGGLGLYFYTSTRVLLVILPIWLLAAWLRDRAKVRRLGSKWLVLLASATVVVLPLAVFYALHPAEFMAPMSRVSLLGAWLTNEVAATGMPAWRILLNRLGDSALAFTASNLQTWYRIDHPMLLPLPATLFLVGVVISLWRALDLRYTWLLLWLGAGVAVGGLSESTPAAQRYIFVAPAVALLVALPLAEIAARFPQATRLGRALLVLGLSGILLTATVLDLRFYFEDYTPSHSFSDPNTEVAQNLGSFLRDSGLADEGVQVYFSGWPRMGWDSVRTLPYLAPEATFIDIPEPLTALPKWEVARPAAFVFLPQNLGDLAWVRQAYPGGETIQRASVSGGQLYTLYLLR